MSILPSVKKNFLPILFSILIVSLIIISILIPAISLFAGIAVLFLGTGALLCLTAHKIMIDTTSEKKQFIKEPLKARELSKQIAREKETKNNSFIKYKEEMPRVSVEAPLVITNRAPNHNTTWTDRCSGRQQIERSRI